MPAECGRYLVIFYVNHWLRQRWYLSFETGMVVLAPKWVRLAPNGTNPGNFQIRFSTFWRTAKSGNRVRKCSDIIEFFVFQTWWPLKLWKLKRRDFAKCSVISVHDLGIGYFLCWQFNPQSFTQSNTGRKNILGK